MCRCACFTGIVLFIWLCCSCVAKFTFTWTVLNKYRLNRIPCHTTGMTSFTGGQRLAVHWIDFLGKRWLWKLELPGIAFKCTQSCTAKKCIRIIQPDRAYKFTWQVLHQLVLSCCCSYNSNKDRSLTYSYTTHMCVTSVKWCLKMLPCWMIRYVSSAFIYIWKSYVILHAGDLRGQNISVFKRNYRYVKILLSINSVCLQTNMT